MKKFFLNVNLLISLALLFLILKNIIVVKAQVTVTQTPTNVENQSSQGQSASTNFLLDLLKLLFSFYSNSPGQTLVGTPIPQGSQSANLNPLPTSSLTQENTINLTSLRDLFQEVSSKVGIPGRVIEAVMLIEYPTAFNYTSDQVNSYSLPGNQIPGCGPNMCSAEGPMQMTIGIDNQGSSSCSSCCFPTCLSSCPNAWGGYGQSVNNYNAPIHNTSACNLRDSVYAAAQKLKNDSGATTSSWTQDQVYQAARHYYGACDNSHRYARLGNRTYCEFVWWYYTLQS